MDPRPQPEPVKYICKDCGAENRQEVLDVNKIECQICSCRILYKKRTKKIVQHLAR